MSDYHCAGADFRPTKRRWRVMNFRVRVGVGSRCVSARIQVLICKFGSGTLCNPVPQWCAT